MIIIKTYCSDTVCSELRRLIRQNGLDQMVTVRPAGTEGPADIIIADGEANVREKATVLIAALEGGPLPANGAGAHTVVTVGLDSRNTITPSSMLHKGGMAALQRELISLGGEIIGPREIDLTHLKGSMTEKMAAAAAMLVLNASVPW